MGSPEWECEVQRAKNELLGYSWAGKTFINDAQWIDDYIEICEAALAEFFGYK